MIIRFVEANNHLTLYEFVSLDFCPQEGDDVRLGDILNPETITNYHVYTRIFDVVNGVIILEVEKI